MALNLADLSSADLDVVRDGINHDLIKDLNSNNFVTSGLVTFADLGAEVRPGTGNEITTRLISTKFESADFESTSDETAITGTGNGDVRQFFVRGYLNKAYKAYDNTRNRAGGYDPIERLVQDIVRGVDASRNQMAIAALKGMIANAAAAAALTESAELMIGDVATPMSHSKMLDAVAAFGDMPTEGGFIVSHSGIKALAQKANVLSTVFKSEQGEFTQYMGRTWIVDDALPVDTIAFGRGAALEVDFSPVELALKRDEAAGNGAGSTLAIVRRSDAFAMAGHSYVGNGAVNKATFELANTWSYINGVDAKMIPVRFIKHNGTWA